jgi:3-deoxy-D-manno-octulosonate 8-phosphate phosphatase (KDO 8-P phosphatase)
MSQPSLAERCRRIDWLILDVDGVLTDGRIVYTDDGVELKRFHVRDGSALKIWELAGKRTAILSGRNSPAVSRRAGELGIGTVLQGAGDKKQAYERLLADNRVRGEACCFVGDDLPDLPLMTRCGLAVAVADASPELIFKAHHVTKARGGEGAVREVVELVLGSQGRWQEIVDQLAGAHPGQ